MITQKAIRKGILDDPSRTLRKCSLGQSRISDNGVVSGRWQKKRHTMQGA
jgi:hypothetical protein